jgi:hypothetical protein
VMNIVLVAKASCRQHRKRSSLTGNTKLLVMT